MTVAGASACRGANEGDSILASMDGAASVSTAIVRSINDAVVEDYVLRTLSRGTGAVARAEPCVTAANRTSQRPSALVNPPFAEASIVQRDRAMRALGAYAFFLATVSRDDASAADSAFARAQFERAITALSLAANVHAPGDLFLEDRAAALATLVRTSHDARDRAAMRDVLLGATTSMQRLVALVRADAAKRRLEAIAATQHEIGDLIAYGSSVSGDTESSLAPTRGLVPCSEPPVSGFAASTATEPSPSAAFLDRLPPGIRARAANARDRLRALMAVDLEAVFEALLDGTRAAASVPAQTAPSEDAMKRLRGAAAAAVTSGLPLFSARL